MPELEGRAETPWRPLAEAGMAAAGMCLFALFIHSGLPLVVLSACGLLITLFAFHRSITAEFSAAKTFGLSLLSRRAGVCTVLACIVGVGFAIAYRNRSGWDLLPGALGRFAVFAALIGAAEELVYRGYIQGRASRLGPVRAVALAALCHTAYKCALFVLPGVAADTNFAFIIRWTVLGGMAFGVLRELGRSVVPPVAAHVVFDILVYGEYTEAPWWVWS